MSLEQLSQMVEKQSEVVRTKYNVNAVAFRVETVDGKVKLKAKPLQE
ncbi:MAG: MXAN_5187 C-terminal domain-containing protein [Thermoanaerobaculia bacterium]